MEKKTEKSLAPITKRGGEHMQPVAPCKDCPEREAGCHDRCEKYQEFRKTRREFNQKMGELGIYNTYLADRKAKIHDTMEKKKKR